MWVLSVLEWHLPDHAICLSGSCIISLVLPSATKLQRLRFCTCLRVIMFTGARVFVFVVRRVGSLYFSWGCIRGEWPIAGLDTTPDQRTQPPQSLHETKHPWGAKADSHAWNKTLPPSTKTTTLLQSINSLVK